LWKDLSHRKRYLSGESVRERSDGSSIAFRWVVYHSTMEFSVLRFRIKSASREVKRCVEFLHARRRAGEARTGGWGIVLYGWRGKVIRGGARGIEHRRGDA